MYYTKYRPQRFSDISKPNSVAEALSNQLKSGKTGHAYLFIGSRGTGKTTSARILAKAVNCNKLLKSGDPCNKCGSCEAITIGNFMDLIEIDAASNRGIDDVRELRDRINLAPSSGVKKVYIVDEVHMLTAEAFNALLKTLEEPPEHAVFVLCTTEGHKVPDTIKSRCQVFKFKRATVEQLVKKMEEICVAERAKSKIKKGDLEKIAKASFGGFRDAETLLQQIVEGELDVDSFVGVGSRQTLIRFVDSVQVCDVNSAIRQVNTIYEDGVDLHSWTMELLKHFRDLLFISADAHEGLIDVTDSDFLSMEEQASRMEPIEIVKMAEIFILAQNEIKRSSISQLPIELAIVKICSEGSSKSTQTTNLGEEKPEVERKSSTKKTLSKLSINIKDIEGAWSDILKGVAKHNHGVQALLKASRPAEIDGGSLILEVFYKFHKERLESPKNKKTVEEVMNEIFGEAIGLVCVLGSGKPRKSEKHESGELTDANVSVSEDVSLGDSIVDVFDGSLQI